MKRLIITLFLVGILHGSATAGQVRITPVGEAFDLAVSVKSTRFDQTTPVPADADGVFVFSFDQGLFGQSAYVERIFVLTWTPRAPDSPATGVRVFSVELPVLLRFWKVDDIYPIKAWPFDGIGDAKMAELEDLTNPEDQWRKLFASLQQADHYAHRVRPTTGEARRAFNTAVDALVSIATGTEARWLRAPVGLGEQIQDSFARDQRKRDSLFVALQNVESLVWRDLSDSSQLRQIACDLVPGTFAYLDRRRSDDQQSYRLQVTNSEDLLDQVQQQASQRCNGQSASPPSG